MGKLIQVGSWIFDPADMKAAKVSRIEPLEFLERTTMTSRRTEPEVSAKKRRKGGNS